MQNKMNSWNNILPALHQDPKKANKLHYPLHLLRITADVSLLVDEQETCKKHIIFVCICDPGGQEHTKE